MNMINVEADTTNQNYISIHPGVVYEKGIGRYRKHPLKNTMKANRRTGKVMKFVTDRFDRRMSGWEGTMKTVDAKWRSGFKKPGSRNPGKLRNR